MEDVVLLKRLGWVFFVCLFVYWGGLLLVYGFFLIYSFTAIATALGCNSGEPDFVLLSISNLLPWA